MPMISSGVVRVHAALSLAAGLLLSGATSALSMNELADNAEFSGYLGAQMRWFYDDPIDPRQDDAVVAFSFEPEWYTQWNNGDDALTFKPFLRLDTVDSERSHFDIRELYWLHAHSGWEFGVGISKVYWGVTESQHLVDIVNQTDLVEAPDGEEKLGQPMLRVSTVRDWGIVDVFLLPGFRERTFPGKDGRLRGALPIDADAVQYESAAEENHVDVAARWNNSFGAVDIGLSHFFGTSRDPLLLPVSAAGVPVKLIPYYEQIQQWGVDAQAITGSWLWKLESIYRKSDRDDFTALTTGFEYTFVGIFERAWDLGVLLEYSHDSRSAPIAGALQDDVFVGGRFAFNDVDSSEILFGVIQDREYSSSLSGLVEANTRVGEQIKLYIEAQFFNSDEAKDPVFQLRRDSYIEVSAEYYF